MLQFSRVCKSFADRRVLHDLTFQIHPGDVFGLLGPNGAGKSTAFNIICNLMTADSGTVTINGQHPRAVSKNVLGVVTQQIALYQNLQVSENLEFFGAIYGLGGKPLAARVAACLEDIQLTDRRSSVVRDLSGGMQRRVHVAAALVHEPRLLILDEPSVGLDVESRQQLWNLVRKLQSQGTAILLTTHLLDEAEALCSRIGILRSGRLIAEGTPQELRSRIPAVEVAIIQSGELDRVSSIAAEQGFTTRALDHGLAIWLNRRMDLRETLGLFEGVKIDSISRRPITLEDAYLEVSREHNHAFAPEDKAG